MQRSTKWIGRESRGHARRRTITCTQTYGTVPIEWLEPRTLLSQIPETGIKPPAASLNTDHNASVKRIKWQGQTLEARSGEWILRLDNLQGERATQVRLAKARLRKVRPDLSVRAHLGSDGLFLISVADTRAGYKQLRTALARLPGFDSLEPNLVVRAHGTFPTDPKFTDLWGLHNTGQLGGTVDADIDAPEAWSIATGDVSTVVAVIDTGIDYTHPDLAANIWRNPGEIPNNGLDDDGNGYIDDYYGYDFVGANDSDPFDDEGHGTHVAGTIGAVSNNQLGVVGVNWNVQLMALKFLDSSGSGSLADAIEAINYATMMRQRGINICVTNNSWGGGGFSQELYNAIQASAAANILFVAAAGNESRNNDIYESYPASYNLPNIVSVAATDRFDNLAGFSNYGAQSVDLGAPGVDILSTTRGGGYESLDGTSMATPHVAGVAALAWSLSPQAGYTTIRDAILAGGDPVASLSGRTATGRRLNARGTLDRLGMLVSASLPADGQILSSPPTAFAITFKDPFEPSSVGADDFRVNGIPADAVTLDGPRTVTFQYVVSPVVAEGQYTMLLAAGSILRLGDNSPLTAWTGRFRYDLVAGQVVGTTPAPGTLVQLPMTRIDLAFNEPVNPGSLDRTDLLLSHGTVIAAEPLGPAGVRYHLSGIQHETALTVNLLPGSVTDVYGNPIQPFAATYALDFGTMAYPTPLGIKRPIGSLIYDPVVSGTIGAAGDEDFFTITVDGGQLMTVVVEPDAALRPDVQILANGLFLAGGSSTYRGVAAVAQSIAAGTTDYTIRVAGLGDTAGAYTLRVILNAGVEAENRGGAPNNTPDDAEPLIAMPLTPGSRRAAVLGRLPSQAGTPVISEGFENALLGPAWSTYSSTAGRIQLTGAYGAAGGSSALLMDSGIDNLYALNEAIWTVNLAGLVNPVLTFDHKSFGDEEEPFYGPFTDHANADGVAISIDGVSWYPAWNAWTSPGWETITIDLTSAAGAAGISLAGELRIKFQQYDNYGLDLDGRGWDNVTISLPDPNEDWYCFALDAGISASLVLSTLGAGTAALDLFDQQGTLLATGVTTHGNVTACIDGLLASSTGAYRVRISGYDAEYSLTLLESAAFHLEANNSPATAQDITGRGTVLGSVGAYSLGRLFAYDATASEIRELDPATGAIIRSMPSPVAKAPGPDFGMATTATSLLVGGDKTADLVEISPDTGQTLRTIPNPGVDVSGIAFLDNEIFLLADEPAGTVRVLDYVTGALKRTITSPYVNEGLGASATALYGTDGDFLYQIDPVSGLATSVGRLANADYSEGLGIIGNELYVADGSVVQVYDLATLRPLRVLTGLNNLEAIGADGGGYDEDFYRVRLRAGDEIELRTATPGDGPGVFDNLLDPWLEVRDPASQFVGSDDNSAGDGRNALLRFTAATEGFYTIRVGSAGGTAGEYLLSIQGATGPRPAFTVASTDPPQGSILASLGQITIRFNDQVLLSSLSADDVLLDGMPATDMRIIDGKTAMFTVAPQPEGVRTVTIAAGSVQDLQGTPIEAYTGHFRIDRSGPRIVDCSIQQDQVLPAGHVTAAFTFDEPINSAALAAANFTLVGQASGAHAAASFAYDPAAWCLTLEFRSLPEDRFTLTLYSGSAGIRDLLDNPLDGEALNWPIPPNRTGDGLPGGDFVLSFLTDISTADLTTSFTYLRPRGSLVYRATAHGTIGTVEDVDQWQVLLESGQTLSVAAHSSPQLRPTLALILDQQTIATATAAEAGKGAVLQTIPISQSGLYTIRLLGADGSSGSYEIEALLNALSEPEEYDGARNDTPASADDLDGSAMQLTQRGRRLASVGRLPASFGTVLYSEDFESAQLGPQWSTYSTAGGWVRTSGQWGSAKGSRALLMDNPWDNGTHALNEAIWRVNLQGRDNLRLSFAHKSFSDEPDTYAGSFTGHVKADGVAISADGITWHWVWNAPDDYQWTTHTLNLSALAAAAGITMTASFQIKFQQYDNWAIDTDGRGWDDVRITTANVATDDWYSLNLLAGEAVMLTATLQEGTSACELFVYGLTDQLLTASSPVAGVAGQSAASFVAPADGRYRVRVVGRDAVYVLVANIGVVGEIEPNDSIETAQVIDQTGLALGAIVAGAPPMPQEIEPNDDGVAGASLADLPLANDLSGSFVAEEPGVYALTVVGNIQAGDDADWDFFRILAQPGDVLDVAMTGQTLPDTFLWLVDRNGVVRASNDDSGGSTNSHITFSSFDYAGDFYIVADGFGDLTGTYLLEVRLQTPQLLGQADPGDFYRFEAKAGDLIDAMTSTPGDRPGLFENLFDPAIDLFTGDGLLLRSDDNSDPDGRNARVQYVAPGDGIYQVRVRGVANTAGEYLLKVSAGPLSIPSSPQADVYRLASLPGGGLIEFSIGSGGQLTTYSLLRSTLAGVIIRGMGGDDRLIIDATYGNPLPDSGLAFEAGDGIDQIELIGSPEADLVALTAGELRLGERPIACGGTERLSVIGQQDDRVDVSFVAVQLLIDGPALTIRQQADVTLSGVAHLAGLIIEDARLVLAGGAGSLLRTSGLTISGGRLDIADGDLIVEAATAAAIEELVASARNAAGAPPTGPGIYSRLESPGSFKGVGVRTGPGGAVQARFSWTGDTDLNGRLNADDYFRIDKGIHAFRQGQPIAALYAEGDFDYDGDIDIDDYILIDSAWVASQAD